MNALTSTSIRYATAVAAAFCLLAASCRSCPQPSVAELQADTVRETHTVYVSRNLSDSVSSSIYVRDSVAPRLDSLGRVVGFDSWHFRDRTLFSRRSRADSVARVDTVWRDRIRTRTVTVSRNIPSKTSLLTAILVCFGVAYIVTIGINIVKSFRKT